jgi:hypothetical protein
MALHSRKSFCNLLSISQAYLKVNLDRGKIVLNKDNYIDDENPTNATFIQIRQNSNKKEEKELPKSKENDEKNETSSGTSRYKIELEIKQKQRDKLIQEIELNRIKIEKLNGEVIPAEIIKPVFLQHNQHLLMSMKNADDEMLSIFGHKYSLALEDIAWIRGEWTKKRNTAITEATNASIKAVDVIVADFSVKRGVGQK